MNAYIVTGLGFGDEGKGITVDLLCRHTGAKLVVRHNGGAQAAHNVVSSTGQHHTFAQLGSGSFVPGVRTLLSEYMMVNPFTFLNELDVFTRKGQDMSGRVLVDTAARLTTPYHVYLNRAREAARGSARHGTTGMGVSETVLDHAARPGEAMRVLDLLKGRDHILQGLEATRHALMPDMERFGAEGDFLRLDIGYIADQFTEFLGLVCPTDTSRVHELLRSQEHVVFEGAQGVLLDEDHGFHPHTTWSKTTASNALRMLRDANIYDERLVRIGVTRTYGTRHGAGPFPGESFDVRFPEPHNGDEGLAGQFRQGWLDVNMLKYAVACTGNVDYLVVNHADCKPRSYCSVNKSYHDFSNAPTNVREQEGLCQRMWHRIPEDYLADTPDNFPEVIAEELGIPLFAVGYGPKAFDKNIINTNITRGKDV